jgi:hypothetical protein
MSEGVNDSGSAVLQIASEAGEQALAICPDGKRAILWDGGAKQDVGRAAPCPKQCRLRQNLSLRLSNEIDSRHGKRPTAWGCLPRANDPGIGQCEMKILFWDVICVAVVCVVLSLGLWPFHSPKNHVTWLENRNGLRFGKFSTVISSSAFQKASAKSETSASVEVWLQPRRIWDSCTFLAFYTPGNPHQFSLGQFNGGFELRAETRNDPYAAKTAIVYVKNTFLKSGPVFLTITSGIHGTAVYADGVLARAAPQVRLSTKDLTGRLVVGDSPGQTDSWSGQLLGIAIYGRELMPTQVLRHYQTWTQRGRPEISDEEGNLALYLLGERTGSIVHDYAGSGVNLYIPEKYVVLDQIFLEPFWSA